MSVYGIVDIYRKDVAGNSLGGNGDQEADISASIPPAHISCLGEYAVNSWGRGSPNSRGGDSTLLSEGGETNRITSLVVFFCFWRDLIRKKIKVVASPSTTQPPITAPIMPLVEIFEPWFLTVGPGAAGFVWFPGVDVLLA
jgi:hypothetical protein